MKFFKFHILLLMLIFISSSIIFALDSDKQEETLVSFGTIDEIGLNGIFKSPQEGNYTLILLHEYGQTKENWKDFIKLLDKNGFGYFVFDLRGHGANASRDNSYKDFKVKNGISPWLLMIDDVEYAERFLEQEKGLSRNKIGIVGAELGANIALRFASIKKEVPFIVLLSPGSSYEGVATESAIRTYKRPIFMISAVGDEYSYDTCLDFMSYLSTNANVNFLTLKGDDKGTKVLKSGVDIKIINWINSLKK